MKRDTKDGLCRIIVAEDREDRRIKTGNFLAEKLRENGLNHEIILKESADDVYDYIMNKKGKCDILVLDYGMPGKMDGCDLIIKLRNEGYEEHIIMFTGHINGIFRYNIHSYDEKLKNKKNVCFVDGILPSVDVYLNSNGRYAEKESVRGYKRLSNLVIDICRKKLENLK